MKTNYILITSLFPLKTELAENLYQPELEKSEYVMEFISSSIVRGNDLIIDGKYLIEIKNKKNEKVCIGMNHLCITNIEYEYDPQDIIFTINQEPKIIGHRVTAKRNNNDIRMSIMSALNLISEISIETELTLITFI